MTEISTTMSTTMNVIEIEILRHRLQALVDEAALVIHRTSVSPIVVESHDYSTAVLDGRGNLMAGGGKITMQFHEATNAVRGVLESHKDIGPGDVFFSNDPHLGGGLQPQDVIILKPVFVEDELMAWVVNSAHMMDMGGMVPGSFAPNAIECYQEAIRLPPVRLVRGGIDQTDVWAILLNNIRMAKLIEMDLRGLVAGVNVGHDRLAALIIDTGLERFRFAISDLNRRNEVAVRARIGELTEGTYTHTTWAEWKGTFHRVPCTLHIEDSRLIFDFAGAAPQLASFINSKEHVVKAMISMYLSYYLLGDLPHNQGYFDAFEVRCPKGSILNSTPPAPVAASHLLASHDAVETALRCLLAAAAASPGSYVSRYLSVVAPHGEQALVTWAGQDDSGEQFVWMMGDSFMRGAGATTDRDGTDFYWEMVGAQTSWEQVDIESTETWYPVRFRHRRRDSRVAHGAFRGGAGAEVVWEPTGSSSLFGTSIGHHEILPSAGAAGGGEGPLSQLIIVHEDGTETVAPITAQQVELKPGECFQVSTGSGAAWGDPLLREPAAVEKDVRAGLVSEQDAKDIYGVVAGDLEATEALRGQIRARRLEQAQPSAQTIKQTGAAPSSASGLPLAPGVEQRGTVAVAVESGAVLAHAPRHWTDGCPVLVETDEHGFERRGYLDPVSGQLLHVELAPAGEPRSFASIPTRWKDAHGTPPFGSVRVATSA